MRVETRTLPSGSIIIKHPDYICSAYDEDLFVEIINPLAADGSVINIEFGLFNGLAILNKTPAQVVMFGGIGRFYFDNFFFTDFTKATIYIYLYILKWGFSFQLYPKKINWRY